MSSLKYYYVMMWGLINDLNLKLKPQKKSFIFIPDIAWSLLKTFLRIYFEMVQLFLVLDQLRCLIKKKFKDSAVIGVNK